MDLANSLTLRSPKPLLKAESWSAASIAFNLLFLLTLAALGRWQAPVAPDVLLLTSSLCALWRIHLQSGGRSWLWSALLAATGFFGFLLPVSSVSDLQTLQFLGGAVIVYGMAWSLAVFGLDEILRPLANIAFLLGVSVFAPPAAMLSAVLISVIFFIACRWKFETGRWWDTILLIYTPAVFAALAIYGLRWLGVRAVFSPEISALLPSHYIFSPSALPKIVCEIYDSFGLFGAVLLLRLLKRESGRADIGLAFIIGVLMLAAVSPISTGVGLRDLALILAVSSAALLAASQTKKSGRPLLASANADVPWGI
jgi:hypothetical protein